MTEKAETATARDGPPDLAPGTAARRTGRQRRPAGAPPPLPHPFALSTAAWLALALAVLASAFLVSLHSPALRVDDRFSTWVLRLLAGIRTPWLTDIAVAIKTVGSSWGVTVIGFSVVALMMVFRRWRHPYTWLIGVLPFLIALFPFYVYLERALPAGY